MFEYLFVSFPWFKCEQNLITIFINHLESFQFWIKLENYQFIVIPGLFKYLSEPTHENIIIKLWITLIHNVHIVSFPQMTFHKDWIIFNCSVATTCMTHRNSNSSGLYSMTKSIFAFIFYVFPSSDACATGCDVNLTVTDTRQCFATEGYPKGYKDNQVCHFNFKAPPGRRIVIFFIDFHLEHDYDYLVLRKLHCKNTTESTKPTHTLQINSTHTHTHIHTHTYVSLQLLM